MYPMWIISIANEKQNITKQPKKQKNQKGILNVQLNKFVFREEKQTCSNQAFLVYVLFSR